MRASSFVAVAATILVANLWTGPASAGTVYLKDGSVLNGKITRLEDGTLDLDTSYAGTLKIAADSLAGLATDKPLLVTLANGDEVQAQLRYAPDNPAGQQLHTTTLGDSSLKLSRLVGLRPPGAPSPAQQKIAALKKQQAQRVQNLWSGQIELGLAGSAGNSEQRHADLRAAAKRESDGDRMLLSAEVHKARENGDDTEDDYLGNARLERDFSSRLFAFGETQVEKDKFQNIDLRFRVTVGPGYFLIRDPDQTLKARVGVGYEHESYTDGGREENLITTFGYDYMIVLRQFFKLTHKLTVIPQVDANPGKNFRVESDLAAELPIGSVGSLWALRAQLTNEFDNNPEPGVDKLDTNYTLNLVRKFP